MALLTDRKFIHFNRKSDFEALLNANAISDKQIVFLKDAQEIWTHGTYYGSVEQFLDETNKDSTNAVSAAAVYQALADDEEVIAAALNDLNDRIENLDIPSKVSDLTDDLSLATLSYVDDKLDDVLGISADGVEAFVNMTRDEDTATGILTEIVNKAPKTNAVNGAPLSNTESYFYGTSTTAAATALKEVSIPSITSLKTGQIIVVKPTITSTVANSTIKLNNFTAYPMRYNNAAITTSTDSIVWAANIPSIWVFDGTYWVFLGHGLDSDTTYSGMTQAEVTAGTSTTNRLISPKLLRDNFYTETECDTNFAKVPLVIEVNDTDTTVPSGTYASIGTALTAGRRVMVKYTIASGDGDSFYLPLVWDASTPDYEYDFGGAYANTIYSVLIASNDTFVGTSSLLLPLSLQSNHIHGNIQSGGTLQTTDISIANGDKLVVTDSSDSSKIARTSVTFDGSTTTQALSKKGTWQSFGTYSKPSGGIPSTDLTSAALTSLGKADTAIQGIKVNGTSVTPDSNKIVDITIPEGELSNNYEPSSSDNEDLLLAAGDTYEEAFGKLEKSINDNEQITAAALTDLDSRINTLHLPQSLDDIPDGSTRKLSDYATTTLLATKQDALVSGTNIKTINNESLLGSGNITISGGSGGGGDVNVIETVKVNGTALVPDANKAVDVTVPTKTSDLTNDSNFTTLSEVTLTIVNSAPTTLDTLNELAAALGNDANFSTTVATQIGQKYTKPNTGIPASDLADGVIPDEKLSSSYQTSTLENDNLLLAGGDTYETAFSKIEKAILDNEETIAASLNDLNTRKIEIDDVPTKTSQLTNDSGYITSFTETDPTVPSHVKSITTTDISNWNNKLSSAPVTSVNGQTGAVSLTIPSAVTESTVSGWGFTKNAGTITGITMNGSSKGTSGVVDLGTVITSETSLSKGTTSGSGNAVTDISVNGHTITLTKGSTFLTSETSLSKGTTSGSGNAVTDISVNGHTITLTKGSTFLTSHLNIKTINSNSLVGTGNVTINELPTVTSSDNGKILQVVNGVWALVTPTSIYSGTSAPDNSTGNDGDLYLQTS